jgi:hypothetical protein
MVTSRCDSKVGALQQRTRLAEVSRCRQSRLDATSPTTSTRPSCLLVSRRRRPGARSRRGPSRALRRGPTPPPPLTGPALRLRAARLCKESRRSPEDRHERRRVSGVHARRQVATVCCSLLVRRARRKRWRSRLIATTQPPGLAFARLFYSSELGQPLRTVRPGLGFRGRYGSSCSNIASQALRPAAPPRRRIGCRLRVQHLERGSPSWRKRALRAWPRSRGVPRAAARSSMTEQRLVRVARLRARRLGRGTAAVRPRSSASHGSQVHGPRAGNGARNWPVFLRPLAATRKLARSRYVEERLAQVVRRSSACAWHAAAAATFA